MSEPESASAGVRLEALGELTVQIDRPQRVGETGRGNRQIVPIVGGTFDGPRLKAQVLPGGGDWSVVRSDGAAELDVRITLQTDDNALVYASYRGYLTNLPEIAGRWRAGEAIPPAEYYLAVAPFFETSAEQYGWLNRVVCVGVGEVIPRGLRYRLYVVQR